MKNINWLVRFKNPLFVTSFVSQIIALAAAFIALGNSFGWWVVQFDSKQVTNSVLSVVTIVLGVLGSFGIVQDPTTSGLSDSAQASTYNKPRDDLSK